jgi:hypothetical protein
LKTSGPSNAGRRGAATSRRGGGYSSPEASQRFGSPRPELPLPRCSAFSPWVTVGVSPRKSSAPVRKLRRRRASPLFSNCAFDRTSRASISEFHEPPSDAASSNDAAAIGTFRYRFAGRLVRFPRSELTFSQRRSNGQTSSSRPISAPWWQSSICLHDLFAIPALRAIISDQK